MHIDLLSANSFANGHPHAQYDWLRDNAPVYWHDEPDGPGFWVVTRYDDVASVGRQPSVFSSEPTIMIADPMPLASELGDHKMLLMMDPPLHTQFRKVISREFTRGPAARLKPRIAELSAQIIDKVIATGECDFVADIAGELPSYVIAELMGIPLSDGRELYKLTEILHSSPEHLSDNAQSEAILKMFEYAQNVYRTKLADPSDDLGSQIVHAEIDGCRLDEIDFQLFFMLLIDAGGDTTRNLTAGGLYELLRHPKALAELQDFPNPDLVESAREELLRVISPVVYMRRTLKRDVELHGTQMKTGDKIVRYFAAANHDPRQFESPQTLDINRFPNEQIAFGTGTHVCLGQHIARVEIDSIFHEVLTRLTDIKMLQEPTWLESNFICGIKTMPIAFRPRK